MWPAARLWGEGSGVSTRTRTPPALAPAPEASWRSAFSARSQSWKVMGVDTQRRRCRFGQTTLLLRIAPVFQDLNFIHMRC